MKNEIKEILDDLKYTAKKHTIQVLKNGEKIEHCPQEIETELRLNTYSANKLLDYITNLQEENRQTKLLKERYQLEKENFKLIIDKAIELCDNLLNNDIVIIKGKEYYKQEADDIITQFIKDTLIRSDEE